MHGTSRSDAIHPLSDSYKRTRPGAEFGDREHNRRLALIRRQPVGRPLLFLLVVL